MELPKNRTALIAGVAVAVVVTTAAVALAVWPALTRPDPPAEASGDNGLRISLVQPPKAGAVRTSPLDVGLSEAAQAMAKGREALFVREPPVRPAPPPARQAPLQVAQADDEDDLAPPPPEPADDRWERDAWRRDRFEEAQRRRWEEEQRWARQDREERAARDEVRERDRYDDRDAAPPPGW
ncbi:hypothetical protein [Caulobacter soli]|uniref:hypothetical protein n=1 Tax=Caulobacter soli TaxID=2708539 RepID=UPI0013ED3776|nr:hypothetical protein [Caulobacter soli]